jgi:hypothetical protein
MTTITPTKPAEAPIWRTWTCQRCDNRTSVRGTPKMCCGLPMRPARKEKDQN